MAYSARDIAKFRKRVEQELRRNPLWGVIASKSKWFCPYCANEAVAKWPPEKDKQVTYVLKHLVEKCPNWGQFRGKYKSAGELNRRKQYRELRTRVKRALVTRKEWQFSDVGRAWYCPFCVQETSVQIPGNRQMNENTLTGIIEHVDRCYEYKRRKMKEQSLRYIQGIVTRENKKKKIRLKVRKALADEIPVWCQRNDKGDWICPYCHEEQQHLDVSSPFARRENAPKQIADHLMATCKPYKEGGPPTMANSAASEEILTLTSSDQIKAIKPKTGRTRAPSPGFKDSDSGLLPVVDVDNDNMQTRKIRAWGKDGEIAAAKAGLTLDAFNRDSSAEVITDTDFSTLLTTRKMSKREIDKVAFDKGSLDKVALDLPDSLKAFEAEFDPRPRRSTMQLDMEMPDAAPHSVTPALPNPGQFEATPGYEFSHQLCQGARGSHDFLDLVKVGPLRIFALGTVTQKNEDPEKVAALTRNLLRIHVRDTTDAGEILKLINNDIFEQLEPKTFVSMALMVLDPRPGRMSFARAGLSTPLLMRPSRRQFARIQDFEGMPLGADKGPMFAPTIATTHVQLEDSDLLIIPSDGVFEVRNRLREPWGRGRFEETVNRYGLHEAEYFTDKLREKIELFARADEFNTDFSVIALKREKTQQVQGFWGA